MNPHEQRAREAKVAKLLPAIPHGRTAAEVATIADWLATRDPQWNALLAARVGVTPPSAETWSQLVAAARARTPLDELEAEAARILGVAS